MLARLFVLLAIAGCSSEEGVADQRQPGDGGTAASGGAAGSTWGDASPDTGSGGSGGATASCAEYCGTLSTLGCTGFDQTSCTGFCDAVTAAIAPGGCDDELAAINGCIVAQPASSFSCDASGNPVTPTAACQSETATFDDCLCSAACTSIVAAGCPATDQAGCETICTALRDGCPACLDSFRGVVICEMTQPATAYECDAQGGTALKPDTCKQQVDAWQACTQAQCP